MDKIKSEKTIKLDKLGTFERPILDAVKEKLRGSQPEYVPLPNDNVGLLVLWKDFYGHGVTERQEMVRAAIESLGRGVARRISIILTLTPDEAADDPES